MSAILPGNNDQEKLEALATRTYKDQAVWFLNAFWDTLESESERIWDYKHKCDEYDLQKHEEGCALDELNAHRLLEAFQETMTVREMRDSLRETGAIKKDGRLKVVPLAHWLVFKYKVDFHSLVNASQGDNRKEIEEAQRLLDEVTEAFKESEAAAQAASAAAREAAQAAQAAKASEEEAKANELAAIAREAEAKASEQDAVAAEAAAVAAQAELEAALAEVKAQEDAYNAKTEALTKKSEEGGVVSRNKAKNELAQHLGEDPLPLRRAKITQEAAVKKAERTTKAAKQARTKAEQDAEQASVARSQAEESARQAIEARQAAEAAQEAAEARKAEAEQALAEASAKVAEAEAFLEDVKSRPGCAHGAIWWMERELHEQKKYLPVSKGGVR